MNQYMRQLLIMKRLCHRIAALVGMIVLVASCSRQPAYAPPLVSGEHAVIKTATLEPDVPRFFTYPFNGTNISFFVLKIDRQITSFLDACATCYMHKRGYRYENGAVTCRYCNMRFGIHKLEKGIGGCYPIKITGRSEDSNYLIPLKTLEAAAGKF